MPISFNYVPTPQPEILRVGTAVSQFQPFSTVYRNAYNYLETNGITLDNRLAEWRKDFREGIVNIGGEAPDIDWFRNLAGSTTKEILATDYYVEYKDALNFNVFADAAVTGTTGTVANAYYETLQNATYTGNYVTFQPITGSYSNNGKDNNVFVGMGLFINEDGEEVTVIKIDKSVDYAWQVTVAPLNGSYIPNIYARTPMAVRPAARTSGYSSTASIFPTTPWNTNGFIEVIQPLEFDRHWQVPMDLDAGYQDVMQFAIIFDNVTGQEVPTWAFKNQLEQINDIKMSATGAMFIGRKNTNTGLTAFNYNQKYNGFDGLMPKMWYGGGNVRFWNNTYGFSLDSDWISIVFTNDALKKSDEMLFLNSLNFQYQFERVNNDYIKNFPGACTFQTFERSSNSDITKKDITSFRWSGYSMHLRKVGAFSDSRYMGNNYVTDLAIAMPGYGMTDSKGQPVSPFEFYMQRGQTMATEWDITMVDGRQTQEQARKWSGAIHHRLQMAVHGVQNMYAIMPQYTN